MRMVHGALGLALLGCSNARQAPETPTTLAVAAINQFATGAYGTLQPSAGNVLLSPLSLHTALSMTAAGARGDTEGEMWRALRNPSDRAMMHASLGGLLRVNNRTSDGLTLRVLNRVYADRSVELRAAFLDVLEKQYGAPPISVDFHGSAGEASREINDWVSQGTEGKIQDLIAPGSIDACTRLVLVNALYFFAKWAFPFEPEFTKPQPFHLADGRTAPVPTMRQTASFRYRERGSARILELPYLSEAGSFVILLPEEGEGLAELEQELAEQGLAPFLERGEAERVDLQLPKFRYEAVAEAVPLLQGLGMRAAFDPNRADFSGAGVSPPSGGCAGRLFVSDVLHKAFVAVDEEGTEAAAATALLMKQESGYSKSRQDPILFHVDKPFIFVLKDQAGAALLIGRVVDPR
jgi:serpin B